MRSTAARPRASGTRRLTTCRPASLTSIRIARPGRRRRTPSAPATAGPRDALVGMSRRRRGRDPGRRGSGRPPRPSVAPRRRAAGRVEAVVGHRSASGRPSRMSAASSRRAASAGIDLAALECAEDASRADPRACRHRGRSGRPRGRRRRRRRTSIGERRRDETDIARHGPHAEGGTTATDGRRSGWPGRPGDRRSTSAAESPGHRADARPGRVAGDGQEAVAADGLDRVRTGVASEAGDDFTSPAGGRSRGAR